jgi:hypothetical protein
MLSRMLGPVVRLVSPADTDLRAVTEYPGLDRVAWVSSLVGVSYSSITRTEKQYRWNLQHQYGG